MNTHFYNIKHALLQLFFPNVCCGCGIDALTAGSKLCVKCIYELPATGFEKYYNNLIEKILAGRVPVENATAQFYFVKESKLQHIMHQFKYRGDKELGKQLGVIMGTRLLESNRFNHIDMLIPVPLHISKKRKRGYNQAQVLCKGIADALLLPVAEDIVTRPAVTETQTRKNRTDRWQNMEGKFLLVDAEAIKGKHILLVDDVITTGATIEACANALIAAPDVKISIATLCYASNI
ncbi:MAG: ComF family protein [Niabella sp.]